MCNMGEEKKYFKKFFSKEHDWSYGSQINDEMDEPYEGQAGEEIRSDASLHYYFVYRHLSVFILEDYDTFLQYMDRGLDYFAAGLEYEWRELEKSGPVKFRYYELPDNPFQFGLFTEPEENPALLFIKPPRPEIVPEAFLIIIAMYYEYARYFTLELS